MLAAFEDRYSTIVPFRNILQVYLSSATGVTCESDNKTFRLDFKNSVNG